jgi:hypothetical protein
MFTKSEERPQLPAPPPDTAHGAIAGWLSRPTGMVQQESPAETSGAGVQNKPV